MELINLKGLNLTTEELRDIIKFIAQKRGISTKQLMPTIKPNPKRKNNEFLTTKTQQKITKTLQKVTKTQQKITKTLQNVVKTQQNVAKPEITKNLTPQKLLKTTKQQRKDKAKKKDKNCKRKT